MIVNGLVSLRQYERISYFRQGFINDLEKSTNVCFAQHAITRWMGITMDSLCMFFSLCSSCFAVYMKGKISTEVLAFSLQILTDVLIFFSLSLRLSADIESMFTSAQRIYRYTQLESEDLLIKETDKDLKNAENRDWPQKGLIEFDNVTMSYRETLEPSVKNLSIVI